LNQVGERITQRNRPRLGKKSTGEKSKYRQGVSKCGGGSRKGMRFNQKAREGKEINGGGGKKSNWNSDRKEEQTTKKKGVGHTTRGKS